MPFSLTNVLATCQALINNVIRAYLDLTAIAYLDNILIYSKTLEEHIPYMQDVLTCLLQAGLLLKPEKCEFYKTSVEFLGFIVTTKGVYISPEKIQAIQEWPTPHDIKSVQGFLGFANFNRRFIEGYSKKALLLTEITKKDTGFRWDTDQKRVFKELKQAYINPLILYIF